MHGSLENEINLLDVELSIAMEEVNHGKDDSEKKDGDVRRADRKNRETDG